METLQELEQQIEELNAEIEEQEDLIRKFKIDQDESGVDHSYNIREAKREIKSLNREIAEIQSQIDNYEYCEDYED